MRRPMKIVGLAVMIAGVCAPRPARAEGYLNPWAGIIVESRDLHQNLEKGFRSFGVSAGDTGSKTGIDLNFGYSDKLFDAATPNYVMDLMAGLTAGPHIGSGDHDGRVYGVGGVGLLRSSRGTTARNDFGFNAGAGVLAYFSAHVGLRAEARYYRTTNGTDLSEFHFVRAQIGLMIR